MNTPLITMDSIEAEKKLKVYRRELGRLKGKQVSGEIKRQYDTMRAAYYELAKGTALVDMVKVFDACPLDASGRPKLALARADAHSVRFGWNSARQMAFEPFHRRKSFRNSTERITLSSERRPPNHTSWQWAAVPMIPIESRPETGKEEDWHILWEVEQWSANRLHAGPDRDPYLLKHLGGSLYAVLAEWDLSELEIAVMRDATR